MRCLKCWKDIDGEIALFTKSCQHVFCETCSEKAFKKELSCPLCDTVLAKDGIGQIVVRPDDTQIRRMGSKLFGLEPEKLCQVLQLGLDFWAKQKQNEAVQHVQQVSGLKKELQEAASQIQKLSRALEDERLKKKSLQNEIEAMRRHVSELETRYAEKARSMRKLSELYSELRQVHKRLEVDLRGVREPPDYDEAERIRESAIGVQTFDKGGQRAPSRQLVAGLARAQSKGRGQSLENYKRTSYSKDQIQDDTLRAGRAASSGRRDSDECRSGAALRTLFELAPRHGSRTFDLERRRNSVGEERNRRSAGAGERVERDKRDDGEGEERTISYKLRCGRKGR